MSARDEILARISTALADRPSGPVIPRDYHGPGAARPLSPDALLALFTDRVTDYHATVIRCAAGEIAVTIAARLAERDVARVITPDGLPPAWWPAGISDQPPLGTQVLDELDGVITTCAVAIAQTGTIVLDHGPGQGRRALTLVPDYHLVVVRADQVVPAVPDAVALLDPVRPMTWISGPSATSDIELSRVEGVHGPRRLDVLLVADPV